MIKNIDASRLDNKFTSGDNVMKWWLGEDLNQITIEDYLKEIETL